MDLHRQINGTENHPGDWWSTNLMCLWWLSRPTVMIMVSWHGLKACLTTSSPHHKLCSPQTRLTTSSAPYKSRQMEPNDHGKLAISPPSCSVRCFGLRYDKSKSARGQAWSSMPVVSALRQESQEFKARLSYVASPRSDRVHETLPQSIKAKRERKYKTGEFLFL